MNQRKRKPKGKGRSVEGRPQTDDPRSSTNGYALPPGHPTSWGAISREKWPGAKPPKPTSPS